MSYKAIINVFIAVVLGLSVSALHAGNDRDDERHEKRLPRAVTDSDYYDNGRPDPAKVKLGQFLFFDKILSGNENIACATCHHPMAGTGDGLSLPVGEGARGLGATRDTGSGLDAVHERVPRNAPHLFNLGATEFNVMFHDGRVQINADHPSGFDSPAGDDLPIGLDNVLAVQAMFPVTSATEMAGQVTENDVADAAAVNNLAGVGGVWDQLAGRLRNIPEYVELFKAAFSDEIQSDADITFVHAANAISAYEAATWRADDSPFDQYLRGDKRAMSPAAKRGMRLFYGKAKCDSCHSGVFQTDQQFHAIAMPQIGPGKGDNLPGYSDGHDDFGRERVTGIPMDRFKFRTPTLRNVALTAPYGHAGAYDKLEAVLRHHLNPEAALYEYDVTQCLLPERNDLDLLDFQVMSDPNRLASIAAASEIGRIRMKEGQIADLIAFLHALTDPAGMDMRNDIPRRVPSGLSLVE